MIFEPLPLAGAFRILPDLRQDSRGAFARTFCASEFAAHGLPTVFVQANMSVTARKGAIRGLHFQRPPMAEDKLIRCVRGAVFDVMVDLRAGSPDFGRWHGLTLSAENRAMILIPKGFAHGFQTLCDDCELIYMHSQVYSPEHEGGIAHDDPDLGILWPLPMSDISSKDQGHPTLRQIGPLAP